MLCGKFDADDESDVFKIEKQLVGELREKKVLANGKNQENRISRYSSDLDMDSCSVDDGNAESVLRVAVSCSVGELDAKQDLGLPLGNVY